ncbi:MAG: translational GTPase TypA [Chlamydiota bacterium]
MYKPEKIRNIAIIAHIDHGKTTLLDCLLGQAETFHENEEIPKRVMDFYELEKERGITIFAKHTSLFVDDYKINVIDTPGHADFSGEVERVLGMVNSVLLIVDVGEGPMPQTRFVLSQALKMGLRPIVVFNKIDKPHADPDNALNKTFDLFVELGADDEQLDFVHCYASAIGGYAFIDERDPRENMRPLFDLILEKVPHPPGNSDAPFLMQASTVSHSDFLGRQATGRILEGRVKKGDSFTLVEKSGHPTTHKVTRIDGYRGLKKLELEEAGVGDIVSISGAGDVMIGDTLCDPDHVRRLPLIELGEPTLAVEISVNSGPFVGLDGKHVTMNKIRERLLQEKKSNISLRVEEIEGCGDIIRVSGRGELHLSILIEAMRREGYEFLVSKPRVIFKENKEEPIEHAHIEVPDEFSGTVIEELSRRKGEMRNFHTDEHRITTLEFSLPTRGLIGYRNPFLTVTRGLGILTSVFDSYGPYRGEIIGRRNGALISMNRGKVTAYAYFTLQNRGTIFVKPGDAVYEGMLIGENSRAGDLVVNITREKQLTNVRASGSDEGLILTPPTVLTLEQAIDFIQDDEFVEVTPHHIRLRKKVLSESLRKSCRR